MPGVCEYEATQHRRAPGHTRLRLGPALLVFALAIATFLPALDNGLFADEVLLLDVRATEWRRSPLSYFGESYWGDLHNSGLYRPLSLAALSMQRGLFERNAVPYRIVNLLVHGICSVLVLLLLVRLLPTPLAFAGALLFAVHPIHAEAVTTIYGQQDLLAALFFLAALVVSMRLAAAGASTVGVLLLSALYLLSLLCKEQGVLLPFLLPVLGLVDPAPASHQRMPLQRVYAGLAISLGIYALLRTAALGSQLVPTADASVGYGYPLWARINLAIVTIATYMRLLVLPWGQTTYYGHLRDSIFGSPVLELAILLGAITLVRPLQQLIGRGTVIRAYVFLAVTLLPVANVLAIGVVVAERCLYLPVFAVCLLVPPAIRGLATGRLRIGTVVMTGVVLAGCILSVRVAARWQTPLSHWESTVSDHPRSAGAHARFALLLLQHAAADSAAADEASLARAEQEIERALHINVRLPEAWQARGMLALLRGDCAAGKAALQQALALRPARQEIQRLLTACQ